MTKYKWENPHDWLATRLQQAASGNGENNVTELFGFAEAMMMRLSADDIQDLFQGDMNADDYFEAETAR